MLLMSHDDRLNNLLSIVYPRCEVEKTLQGGYCELSGKIGFKGQFYIEPKPKEPTKHQYDSDAAACLNFLRQYDLFPHFKLNIETNHATLAGHTMQHELEVAGSAGAVRRPRPR